jgi:hypothetical protein
MRSSGDTAEIGDGQSDLLRRLIVARAQEFPSRLLYSIERGDARALTRFLIQVCQLYIDLPQKTELACMCRTLVEGLLTALGLPVQTDYLRQD